MDTPTWVEEHQKSWDAKPALRKFYQREVYDRVIEHLADGPSLELGAGAGLFSRYFQSRLPAAELVRTDVTEQPGLDAVVDAHDLPFDDGAFANVIYVHVLHHLAVPVQALRESARVLRPGGRVLLVEPWTGALGTLFYKYVHQEDYAPLADPWTGGFGPGKAPMDGNVALPRQILYDRLHEVPEKTGGLHVLGTEHFAGPSYLMTGGFQRSVTLPKVLYDVSSFFERMVPKFLRPTLMLQMFTILEKRPTSDVRTQ